MMSHFIVGKRRAVSNWLRQFKTFIDADRKVYKIQESLLGIFKWGEERPLPETNYVLIFKQLFAKCESCSVDEIEKDNASYYQVSLVHDKNRRTIVDESRNRDMAFAIARKLGEELHVRVKDAANTRKNSSWL